MENVIKTRHYCKRKRLSIPDCYSSSTLPSFWSFASHVITFEGRGWFAVNKKEQFYSRDELFWASVEQLPSRDKVRAAIGPQQGEANWRGCHNENLIASRYLQHFIVCKFWFIDYWKGCQTRHRNILTGLFKEFAPFGPVNHLWILNKDRVRWNFGAYNTFLFISIYS